MTTVISVVLSFMFVLSTTVAADTTKQSGTKTQSGAKVVKPVHAISLYGAPKYPASFTHFNYTNPDAPKGGELKQAAIGTFDTFNPYIDRGTAAAGSDLLYASLLARSWDETLTKYGLIAESIERAPDNRWVAYNINKKARFHDGKPVTANDVKFSFMILREKGSAFYKSFYREVKSVEVTDPYRVVFWFNNPNIRELPLILGQMPVIPEHFWKDKDFSSPGLQIPVGSGPYKVAKFDAGRSVTYERVKNYWAANLPVNAGRNNFNQLRYDYYRDSTVAIEALIAGDCDIKVVSDPRIWYDQIQDSVLTKNKMARETIKNSNPQSLMITYNTRKPLLQDKRVREALGYAFNFKAINHNQFHDIYHRATSFFSGTPLASSGLPSAGELALLSPWKASLPAALFTEPYQPPGSESIDERSKLKKGLDLLKAAGFKLQHNQQVKDGTPLVLEALVMQPNHEKTMLFFQDGLARLGVKLNIRSVDPAQYIERLRNQDFDIIMHTFPHTPSPGTEQASFWGSSTANQHGTRNLAGSHMPAVDDLAQKVADAKNYEELKASVRALDRVLLWEQYTLPLWYLPEWPVIHKQTLQHPENPAPYALDIMTWWFKP